MRLFVRAGGRIIKRILLLVLPPAPPAPTARIAGAVARLARELGWIRRLLSSALAQQALTAGGHLMVVTAPAANGAQITTASDTIVIVPLLTSTRPLQLLSSKSAATKIKERYEEYNISYLSFVRTRDLLCPIRQ